MRHFRSACAIAALVLMTSCAPRREPPAPPPAPPPPPPAPALPAPPPLEWQDAPLSEGDWLYGNEGGRPSAKFGMFGINNNPLFHLSCEAGRRISLIRAGATAGSALTVRTTFGNRALPATVQPEGLVASLPAADPLLDQMVFSRGRFAVQAEGQTLLILPAWPEPARVIEDCRG